MATTKPPGPGKKGVQDIAALKARLGVKAVGVPGAAPGSAAPVVAPPGGGAPGLAPRGPGGPVRTVLPPGMYAPEEDLDRPAPWAVDLSGALDPTALTDEGGKKSGVGIKIIAVVAPALFFVFVGHWCGENNYGRRNHNDRIAEAEMLATRYGATLDEVVKVDKSFKAYYAAMKEKGGKDFSEMENFAKYLAALRLETFIDDESITARTPFMDQGMVTRLLVYYSDLAGFVALANHHGHLVGDHIDDLRKAHETAQGFKDALYAARVPKNPKGGAPVTDASVPGLAASLGTVGIVWIDPKDKDKGIKGWLFFDADSGKDPKAKPEELDKPFAAPVAEESKKAMLQPKNLEMLYDYSARLSDMQKLLTKLTEEGRKILIGAENTIEKEKSGTKLMAF
ncbi:MAG TPA: hypothetical protein VG389_28820 [Myxococcota bacterium]|jgi:hypothetical protein|nr:hypothetical protein [Myxococcota bacterium]